ncbi:Metallo-dependent phosphatase [Athelia psychrophila]|uniref:Metallo-dependent phosphatase n=1 Tax=Athelia psychrophila TaxID=1759441 RepID=A0A166M693_9AGAM|nr:Metallo-dependent phosphatase [Fibularhizoctonia sp. CBS 109695]
MNTLQICHFNDVYRVTPQKLSPSSSDTIDVTQFATMLDDIRGEWPQRADGKREGLVLFSGDVFSPSTESSVSRGSHMVPVMNVLAPDVSLVGNHDFDFGYSHLTKLIQDTTFPWLLSNIIDSNTSQVPESTQEFHVLERNGIRIGVIGLVEKEWIGTVSAWPANFEYRDMAETGKALSKKLRDPEGEYKCDLIIALTHARVPNDIALAKAVLALSPSAQAKTDITSSHGVDILLGGHDHLYYVSKGVTSWEGYDVTEEVLGAEKDQGDVLLVKSGTDFRDLSELTLELQDTPAGSVRRKVIKQIVGKRHSTKPGSEGSPELAELLENLLSGVSSAMKAPVCKTEFELDLRSQFIRTAEASQSAAGNWFADVIRHAYDDALCRDGSTGGSDGVFICAGTLRGDSTYGPGNITLGDILEILPFEDPIVVVELDGQRLWDALEASLETWPAQEGRFPVISGFRVSWDSRRPAGQRVLGIWLQKEIGGSASSSQVNIDDEEEITRKEGGRKYKIVTREYMAQGHDGFLPLKGAPYLIDDESGQLFSALVRKYTLGSRYVNKMARVGTSAFVDHLHPDTRAIIRQAHTKFTRAVKHWHHAAVLAVRHSRSKAHYKDRIDVSGREDMSDVDCFQGAKARKGSIGVGDQGNNTDGDLLLIHPVVDGRLKDEGRQ